MDEIPEVRYPFDNTLEFLQGGHLFRLEGVHLLVALVLLPIGIGWTLRCARGDWLRTVSLLYFSLQPFNNPAFTNIGLVPADICGIIVASAAICRFLVTDLKVNTFILSLAAFGAVAIIHASLIWFADPAFAAQANLLSRYVILFKVPVMMLCFAWIYSTQEPVGYLTQLVRSVAALTIICCLVYLTQLGVFLGTGTFPYGSFAGAGFSLSISFGGVSIERGHLAKFMAPLFCSLLIYTVLYRRKLVAGLYSLIMLINFSASGLAFLTFQALGAAVLFWRQVRRFVFSPFGFLTSGAIAVALVSFSSAYGAIIQKIYRLAIRGDETDLGGRSVGLLLRYLADYPFGIGYSGSSFRTAPGLAEINMGIYAFLSQMSFLSLLFMALVIFSVAKLSVQFGRGSAVARILLVGAISLPFVFSADILWFVPLWWLPLFMLLSFPDTFLSMTDEDWQRAAASEMVSVRKPSTRPA